MLMLQTLLIGMVYDHIRFHPGASQIPFIVNIFITLSTKKSEDRNPWKSTTIEWSTFATSATCQF